MKTHFKKSDVVDQEFLNRDIQETYQRLLKNKRNTNRRTPEQILADTELSLVFEHYLMQEDKKFKKATQLNPTDYYHDLVDTTCNEIHECKVTRGEKGWDNFWITKKIHEIVSRGYNHSTWMHLANYDVDSGVYTYQGFKRIRL
jgi:hypothetical protein